MIDEKTRILFLVADKHGCGHYRALNFATALKTHGYDVMVVMPNVPPENLGAILPNHDVLIYQRPAHVAMNDTVFSSGKPVIIETDDMIDALTPENPAYKHYQNGSEGIKAYTAAIKAAKGILCSTNYLACHNMRYNSNCAVVPNYIDASLREWWPRTIYLDNFVRVGWAGSTSHNEDIVPAIVAAADVCSRYDNTRLMLMSNIPMLRGIVARNIPPQQQKCIEFVNPVEFADYPIWVNWDVGLAPIRDTDFNRGKSALKYLEYSAKAITTIASPVIPYLETIPEGCALYPRSHTVADWAEQIDYAVTHADTAGPEMGVRSYQHVVENWLLEDHWTTWVAAVSRLMEGAGGNVTAAPKKVGRNDLCPCGSGRKYKRCHGI